MDIRRKSYVSHSIFLCQSKFEFQKQNPKFFFIITTNKYDFIMTRKLNTKRYNYGDDFSNKPFQSHFRANIMVLIFAYKTSKPNPVVGWQANPLWYFESKRFLSKTFQIIQWLSLSLGGIRHDLRIRQKNFTN